MADLDFCKLEVTVIHSLQTFTSMTDKFNNIFQITKYFNMQNNSVMDFPEYLNTSLILDNNNDTVIQLQFDNTQLDCELKIIDSTEDNSDSFVFKVYNLPENTILYADDYLLFKFYWESDPNNYTSYHGLIKTVSAKRSSANILTTVKGQLVHQNILYNWSIYDKYPKLEYYSDIKDFVEQELKFEFISMIHGFTTNMKLPTPILTRGKSVGSILEEVCSQLTSNVLSKDECLWKFVNGQTILLYKRSDLGRRILNERFKIPVPSIKYADLLAYTITDGEYTIELFGLPTVVAGIVIYIDAEEVPEYISVESAYYIVNEIEHNITLTSGYNVKIYASITQ